MKKLLVIAAVAAALISALFIPIGNPESSRYGPFQSSLKDPYEIVDLRGRVFKVEILSVRWDSVIIFDHQAPHFRLDSVARISQNGIHYYQNPRVPPANSGRPATEREKWKGEERWNVLGLLIVVFAAWMGWLH